MKADSSVMIATAPTERMAQGWPRIALITPVRNSAKYVEQTIRSVVAQEYPNLDYFIVDGSSTDGTLDIIRKYEKQISGWLSEPDNGMYDALNKGFARTSGEIMGWISGTDILHPGALRVVGSVFRQLPGVEWITGRATACTEDGMTSVIFPIPRWARYRFLMGANRAIQQESTFWRRRLWDKAGGYVDASRRLVSDFELWVRFFRYAQLYSVDALIGCFRLHGDSLGSQFLDACYRIHDEHIETELARITGGKAVKLFRSLGSHVRKIRGLRYAWWRLVERPLYSLPGPDCAPVIRYHMNMGWRCDR